MFREREHDTYSLDGIEPNTTECSPASTDLNRSLTVLQELKSKFWAQQKTDCSSLFYLIV
jgi:hypothetical protein